MEKYQFKIGDIIIRTPEGWKDFELRLKRDEDISGLLVSSTNKFTFWGDGYDILKERFDTNYSDKVFVTIDILQADNTYIEQYSGVIILTEVLFNLEKLFAEATVEDANFQGAIQNNKNIKSFLNARLTKNGEEVDVLTVFDLDYFNDAGVFQGLLNRRAYLLKDAIDFLVRFMTDNEVKGIESAYLDDTTNWEGVLPYITTGASIRLASQDAPNVSFAQLIIFLQRTHDLTFDFIEDVGGNPVMRIEKSSFFFQETSVDTIRDITDLTVKIDSSRIASHLEVGNNTSRDAGNCSATTRFFSFVKEDYSLRGKGNIDSLLDLTTDIVTDSNVIGAIVTSGVDTFDDDIIIVLGNVAGTQAEQFTTTTHCSNNPMYNLGFANDKIIDRQIDSIPNSLTKYLTAATTPSKAELGPNITGNIPITTIGDGTVPALEEIQVNFNNEKYDLGNNYNTSNPNNTFYDVPFTGSFSFEVSVKTIFSIATTIFAGAGGFAIISYQTILERFDSSFTTSKESVVVTQQFLLAGSVGALKESINTIAATMNCDTGDRLIVKNAMVIQAGIETSSIGFIVASSDISTFFKCLGSDEDAGTYRVFDPNSFRARQYKFEKNLSLTRTNNIRANSRNSIIINELSDTELDKETWIEEMVNNIETSRVSFITIK